jgi:predicted nucleic acid-binding protein
MYLGDWLSSVPFLFDSSIYVNAFRKAGDAFALFQRWEQRSPLWLSSVVLEELYAGADAAGYRILAKMEHDFELAGRILTPNHGDWTRAGKVLAQVGQKYGYEQIGKARLANDTLIAVSAARTGVTVLTANQRDFARLAEFCSLQWQAKTA